MRVLNVSMFDYYCILKNLFIEKQNLLFEKNGYIWSLKMYLYIQTFQAISASAASVAKLACKL